MLELVFGRSRKKNTEYLLSKLREAVRSRRPRQIVVVPEQYSHDTERLLCEECGDTVSLYAEVLTFSRMADRTAALYGGAARETLDDGGRFTALLLAMEQVSSRLKIYGAARMKPELVRQLAEQIEEFKSCRIQPEELRAASALLEGVFAEKLSELSLIMESYDAVCKTGKADPSDKLLRLGAQLLDTDFAEGASFYLDGFTDFTALQRGVIEALLQKDCRVRVTLVCDDLRQGASVFSAARGTAAWLMETARRLDVEMSVTAQPIDGGRGADFLRTHLFGYEPAVSEDTEYLSLIHAGSAEDACVHAMTELRRLLMRGFRCRDILIVCTERGVYMPILRRMFPRYKLPAYYTGRESILTEPAVQGILDALRAVVFGFEAEDVFAFLHSALGMLPRDDCDRLQNYVYTWKIRGAMWFREWTMPPDGFGGKETEETARRLRELNEWREAVAQPFRRLKTGLEADTGAQVRALYDFLEELCAEERLQSVAALHPQADQRAQELGQLYDILLQILEQLALVLGETVRTAEGFYYLLRETLGQYSLASIPASLDSVTVAEVSSSRYLRRPVVMILGAGDGKLPSFSAGSGILSDQERELLRKKTDLKLAADRNDRIERETASAYDVLCAAEERLIVSYVGKEPSYLFQRLQELYPACTVREAQTDDLPDLRAVGALLAAGSLELPKDSADPALLTAAEELEKRAAYQVGTLEPDAVRLLYSGRLRLSASQIDKFFSCRLAYFLTYGLKAEPRREAEVDAPVFGTFVHDVLEHTVHAVQEEGGFAAVSGERVRELTEENIRRYADTELKALAELDPRARYLFERNLSEVYEILDSLSEELKKSEFRPAAFELDFRPGGTLPPIAVSARNGEAGVVGYIDRVDLYDDGAEAYVRVVDYKTGKKEFDYTDLLNGLGMQMLIYLFALQSCGETLWGKPVRPAGVLYFPAKAPIVSFQHSPLPEELEKERQKAVKRTGIVLDNDRILSAMEDYFDSPQYLPFAVGRDGEKKGDLATAEQMELLRRWVFRKTAEMTEAVLSGRTEANPFFRGDDHSACRFCDFASVCHADSADVEKRFLKKKSAAEFWKLLEEVRDV